MPERAGSGGRLTLLGEIARGGMGAILKGRDNDIGRDLVVKVLLEQHRERSDLVERFVEEAQIAGQLQHPGVVPVYELGQFADRRPFFTIKLVKGRTLADLLAERSATPSLLPLGEGARRADEGRPSLSDLPRVVSIFHQVCQTVAYAHARGVIHRDLKPSNVMVGNFGEVQVMDWGLAKVLTRGGATDDEAAGMVDVHETVIATARSTLELDQSQAGSVLGTPAYMAPEQALGELDTVDERSDVFSLGSILCEILTGQAAFTGRSKGEIMRKAGRCDVADAFARLDACGAHPELIALGRSCLAPEREDRPRDSGAIAARLTAHLAGVQERLRAAELAHAAESARALEAERTTALAEARARAERRARRMTTALAASLLALTTPGRPHLHLHRLPAAGPRRGHRPHRGPGRNLARAGPRPARRGHSLAPGLGCRRAGGKRPGWRRVRSRRPSGTDQGRRHHGPQGRRARQDPAAKVGRCPRQPAGCRARGDRRGLQRGVPRG
jgi:serine/threonine-protein kinase